MKPLVTQRIDIPALQRYVSTPDDGFWGPKSTRAAQKHLRAFMPVRSPWPKPDQTSLRRFYGRPDDNGPIIRIDPPTFLRLYNTNKPLKSIYIHEKCAESYLHVIRAAHDIAPDFVKRWFGVHVDRPMRGSLIPSCHAYGCAADHAASTNRNRQHWPTSANMPIQVMEVFAMEGWTPAGAFWSRDAMHFQATQP